MISIVQSQLIIIFLPFLAFLLTAVFGKIIEGYDVVKEIENSEINAEVPVDPIKLVSIKIERK
jgi:cyclophilin family peptidyl-prolyl cis-trans isomerase